VDATFQSISVGLVILVLRAKIGVPGITAAKLDLFLRKAS
jgi:hypothetical protein